MKMLQDIANLISVRNFLVSSIDNVSIKLSREQVKEIQNSVKVIDQKIVTNSLTLNLDDVGKETHIHQFVRESTEDTETVFHKFATAELTGVLPSGAKLTNEVPTPPSKEILASLTNNQGVSTSTQEVVSYNKPKASKSTFKRTDSDE
jgi:hypothetical protein